MTYYVWPTSWLTPSKTPTPKLLARTFSGGVSVSGVKGTGRTDGGGIWRASWGGITLNTPKLLRAYDAWTAILDMGVTKVIVPKSMGARAPSLAGVAVPEQVFADPFPHLTTYSPTGPIAATVQGTPALRATQMTIRTTTASSVGLTGGEHYAINHTVLGWRRYTVGEVVSTSAGSGYVDHVVNFRPPLREATADTTAVDFNGPACCMVAMGMTDPEDLRHGQVDVVFEETFV